MLLVLVLLFFVAADVEYGRLSGNSVSFPSRNASYRVADSVQIMAGESGLDASFLHLHGISSLMPSLVKIGEANVSNDWVINSAVLEVSLKAHNRNLIRPFVTLYLRRRAPSVQSVCAFWNHVEHYWSTDGCAVISTNSTHVSCSCNHLTAFALLRPQDDPGHGLPLNWLVAVSCGVSAAIFLVLMKLVVRHRHQTIKELVVGYGNVCVLAIFLQVLFLVSVFSTRLPSLACSIFAGALQYFIMAMACNLFLLAVHMMEHSVTRKFRDSVKSSMVQHVVAGWLIPAVVPAVCLAVLYPNRLGVSSKCWVMQENVAAFFIFYIPPGGVLAITATMATFNIALKRRLGTMRLKKATRCSMLWLLAICLYCGCVWLLLPYFMVEHDSRIAAVVFSVANVVWAFCLLLIYTCMHKHSKVYEVKAVQTEAALARLTTPDGLSKCSPSFLGGSVSIDASGTSSLSQHIPRGVTTFDAGQPMRPDLDNRSE